MGRGVQSSLAPPTATPTQYLHALTDLYLGCNALESTRELLHLKAMLQLAVLDISSNPIGRNQACRLFAIYHLTSLKALDGEAIVSIGLGTTHQWPGDWGVGGQVIRFLTPPPQDSDEIAAAKEKLGGR